MADQRKPIQSQKFKLQSSISATATSLTLQSFTTPDGTTITDTDIGSKSYATLSPNTNSEESISFTTIVQNSDGTAVISGITRGLKFVDPYTTDTSLGKTHGSGSLFVLSNTSAYYQDFANKERDETIAGTFTYAAIPGVSSDSVTPISSTDIATKKYVDDNVVGGTVSHDQQIVAGQAGETVAAGEIVYFDDTDNEWKLADASVVGTTDDIMLGIAQGAGTNGNAISGGVLTSGLDKNQSGLTIGDEQFISDTAGAISSSAGTIERAIGFARTATEFYFDPYYNDHPSAIQKDAIAKLPQGTHLFAADAGSDDTYVITLAPVPTAYTTGMVIRFTVNTVNTGAATINVNGLGAKSIVKMKNVALEDGDIQAGQVVSAVYDGTNFQLISGNGEGSKALTNGTSTDISNTTTETAIFTKSVPGNMLGTGNGFTGRIYVTGVNYDDTNATLTLRLKYGSTTLATLIVDPGGQVNGHEGFIDFDMIATSASAQSGALYVHIGQNDLIPEADPTTFETVDATAAGTATETSSGALDLSVTVQWGTASASNNFVVKTVRVQKVIN